MSPDVTTAAVETAIGGRPLLVLRPDWSDPAQCGLALVMAAADARDTGATLCLISEHCLPPCSIDGVPVITADGARGAWLSAVWTAASAARRVRARWRDATSTVARELRRELRRQAGDERLPFDLRQRLREIADAPTLNWRGEIAPFPRRLLRARSGIVVAPELAERARTQLKARGIPDGVPLVAFESRMRPDIAAAVVEFLRGDGYAVARIGDPCDGMRPQDGVVDLTTFSPRSLLLDMCLLSSSAFVVCESTDVQQLAYLTNTASLTINARDPFVAYPVRTNGLFALSTAIDLDSAQTIAIDDMLSERYFRDLRKQEARGRRRGSYGYRDSPAEELIEAIRELNDGIAAGWTTERESQTRFRARVVDAGVALAAISPHVAEWGPDQGFIGDGRLVRFQAERVS